MPTQDSSKATKATPDDSRAVDILMSKIYHTTDTEHPEQRVMFGVKLVGGIPHPVIERRDANTGYVIKSYLDGSNL